MRLKVTDVNRMVDLYEQGLPLSEVAEAIGCSQSSVFNYLRQRGVRIRGTGGGGGAGTNPIVCGRKFCAGCGRWRHICDFSSNKREPKLALNSRCRTCERIAQREMRADPMRGGLRREYERIWHESKRRQRGVPERNWGPRSRIPRGLYGSTNSLDPRPLAEIIQEWMRIFEAQNGEGFGAVGSGAQEHLAEMAEVSSRRIHAMLYHERYNERIAISTADRICTALGLHLDLVYPGAGVR